MKIIKCIGFWIWSCTWGCIMTVIGLIGALYFLSKGVTPRVVGYALIFDYGYSWGAISLGPIIFASNSPYNKYDEHEYGHCIQNLIWGPLFPFVIGLPSIIRAAYRGHVQKVDYEKYLTFPGYYEIWFENQANTFGAKFLNK